MTEIKLTRWETALVNAVVSRCQLMAHKEPRQFTKPDNRRAIVLEVIRWLGYEPEPNLELELHGKDGSDGQDFR